jgi:hypothetical protein
MNHLGYVPPLALDRENATNEEGRTADGEDGELPSMCTPEDMPKWQVSRALGKGRRTSGTEGSDEQAVGFGERECNSEKEE